MLTAEQLDRQFLLDQVAGLTTDRLRLKVSEWAAKKRYLPKALTTKPGKWDNDYTPYLTEPMDCLSEDHPAREIAVMKGTQIGFTTGVGENFFGYTIDHDPAAMMYINADLDLAKIAIKLRIEPMLEHAGLAGKLRAPGRTTKRSGDTSAMKEFPGGFLLALGANSPNKFRMSSVRKVFADEIDGMPRVIGAAGKEEGGLVSLVNARTMTYESNRKVLYGSTPLKMETSLIYPLFMAGDQRHYHVPCPRCGEFQPLEWHGVREDGEPFGIRFDWNPDNTLVEDSVRYACRYCLGTFVNAEKSLFLKEGKWVAHSKTTRTGLVSFHMPALLSPVGMHTWTALTQSWLEAWDMPRNRMKDVDAFQAFYNLKRGLPYEDRGESPSFDKVQLHRRMTYGEGEIPNRLVIEETGHPIVFLTGAVDVHADRLDFEIVGWCHDRQSYSLGWYSLLGDPNDLTDAGPWAKLSEFIEGREFIADDGRRYVITMTVIDVQWDEKADACYQFCQQFSRGVYPILGRQEATIGAALKQFNQTTSASGSTVFTVTTTFYKDRLAHWLTKDWNPGEIQPQGYPNYPRERSDDFFHQYASEHKKQRHNKTTGQRQGHIWERIGSRPNHAWDCRVYGMAAYDMVVYEICTELLGIEQLSYLDFSNYATPKQNAAGKWIATHFSTHPDEVPE